ncbi:helix-turn-helix domain-containing protein [Oceanobacillus profundus]|uniref:helix-turn-helix domain-containing protein n=1 Tax=Oceanobacillus profundus TaxID=372463 RepID=UPI00203A6E2F|nr:helix-turn-helix transcriptional regulator [Oceanobacillus profundus]MCM3396450.1 helix-turn-helix domain-containing protein [Oceanobacillus profundus]
MRFGPVLRKMRKGAGMSQESMANELHMSISNISRLETDKYELKAVDLIRWCKVTNNPDVLMALYAGAEVVNQLQPITQLITGTILFLGGV